MSKFIISDFKKNYYRDKLFTKKDFHTFILQRENFFNDVNKICKKKKSEIHIDFDKKNLNYFYTNTLVYKIYKKQNLSLRDNKIINLLRIKFEYNLKLREKYDKKNFKALSKKEVNVECYILIAGLLIKHNVFPKVIKVNFILKLLDHIHTLYKNIKNKEMSNLLKKILSNESNLINSYEVR